MCASAYLCVNLWVGLDRSIMTDLLILYSSNVHLFAMYLIVYVLLVRVWGLRDIMYLYLYFLPLELPDRPDPLCPSSLSSLWP